MIDLLFPIITLIVCCIIGMLYSGDFFKGVGFVDAFSGSDASVGLMLGSFFALIITIVFYAVRRVLSFNESCSCIPEGFKAMVPAILILTFAWTLKAMTDSLGAKEFVAGLVKGVSVKYSAGSYISGCGIPCFCNRNIVGNIWNSYSYCCKYIFRNEPYNDDYINLSMYGWSCLWRPLFTNI